MPRGRPRKLLPHAEAKLCRMYVDKDMSLRDLSVLFGLHFTTVANIVSRHGVPRRLRGPPAWSREEFRWHVDGAAS
jgi:hypothetical protein